MASAKSPTKPAEIEAPPQANDFSASVRWILLAIILGGLVAAGVFSSQVPINCDEQEHLHAAWLWAKGVQPYTGFFEHHTPLFWYVLRGVISVESRDLIGLVHRARILSWFFAAGTVAACWWFFAGLLGRRSAWFAAAFVALFAAMSPHFLQVRPDTPMLMLLCAGSALAMRGVGMCGKAPSPLQGLLGGILLSGAICMLAKAVFWVFALAPALLAFAIWQQRTGRGSKALRGVGAIVLGAAIPAAMQVAWVLAANNWGAFWYHNVTVNRAMSASGLHDGVQFANLWSEAMRWPMMSLPLAVVGAAALLARKEPLAWGRKLTAALVLLATIALNLLGNGPHPQYQIPFLLMIAGLAGAGMTLAYDALGRRVGTMAVAALAGLAAVWITIFVLLPSDLWDKRDGMDGQEPSRSRLTKSLERWQAALDRAGPDDTCVAIMQWNPVLMMDADPKLFMKLALFNDEQTRREVADSIRKARPRYIVGYGFPSWTNTGIPAPLRLGEQEAQVLSGYGYRGEDRFILELVEP